MTNAARGLLYIPREYYEISRIALHSRRWGTSRRRMWKTIREIGLRKDQQSPYVVTQFSSGASPFQRLLRFPSCDFLKLELVRRSQCRVRHSALLVSIGILRATCVAIPCVIRVTSRVSISSSFSLRLSS